MSVGSLFGGIAIGLVLVGAGVGLYVVGRETATTEVSNNESGDMRIETGDGSPLPVRTAAAGPVVHTRESELPGKEAQCVSPHVQPNSPGPLAKSTVDQAFQRLVEDNCENGQYVGNDELPATGTIEVDGRQLNYRLTSFP